MGRNCDPKSNKIKAIDASAGSLVWVLWRNGSRWPGRIMCLDKVSEGSLVSLRSGTPVKLLGCEDASVDWYNLEKSKRVKAFRCGEDDECIEKVKTNAASGNQKAVKYARREDAVIHALEIENTSLCMTEEEEEDVDGDGSDSGDSEEDSGSDSDSGSGSDSDLCMDSESESDSDSDLDSESDSAPQLSQSGISFEEPIFFYASKMQSVEGRRRRTPNDSEDDGTEGIKRMRGLEDLGMVVGHSNGWRCFSNCTPIDGSKCHNSSMKRKRMQVANVHEFLKRKNRNQPLTKVLARTEIMSVPVTCDQIPDAGSSPLHGLSGSKISGIDSNESRKNISLIVKNNSDSTGISCEDGASLNPSEHASGTNCELKENDVSEASKIVEKDSSDKLFDVPFVGEEKHSAGFSSVFGSSLERHQVSRQGSQADQYSLAEDASLKGEGLNESGATSSAATHFNSFNQSMEKDAPECQLKGKSNSRHVGKIRRQEKRIYLSMSNKPNASIRSSGQTNGFFQVSDQRAECDGTRRPLDSYNCNLLWQSEGPVINLDSVCNWRKSFPRTDARRAMVDVSLPPQRLLPCHQSCFMVNSRYQTSYLPGKITSGTRIYDVKVEVKANYQPQNVPLVSLMSKLNGKAIIGRPLTVSHLADGYCDDIISSIECDPTHVYSGEAVELMYAATPISEPRRVTANLMTVQPRFSPSRSPKRKGALSRRKVRKLSSLTGNREECRKLLVGKPKGTITACIPLKVVSSRITEAVNGSA